MSVTARRPAQSTAQMQLNLAMCSRAHRAMLAYHQAHPEVYALIVQFAREAKYKGHRGRYGMKAIFERLRWHVNIERGDAEFKINNNLTAPFARFVMEREPDLAGFFETRERRSD